MNAGRAMVVFAAASRPLAHSEPVVWHVNLSATGAGTGVSWADAFIDLQDALADAQSGDEIWVAAGIYKPDRGTGDRSLSFEVPCGVGVYGGFAGWEALRDQRDGNHNKSILSGDLNDDDGPWDCDQVSDCCREEVGRPGCDDALCEALVCAYDPNCCNDESDSLGWRGSCSGTAQLACCHLGNWRRCDNSYQVASVGPCVEPPLLDGIEVRGAYSHSLHDPEVAESGAGVSIHASAIIINNCRFTGSYSSDVGDRGTSMDPRTLITVLNSTFEHPEPGIGIDTWNSDVTARGCEFRNNARVSVNDLALDGRRTTQLTDCRFITAASAQIMGDSVVDRCLFQGGNGLSVSFGRSTITDCVFIGNKRHLRFEVASGVVDNCLFTGSTSQTVKSGGASALFRNCAFLYNSPYSEAIGWGEGSLAVLNCTLMGNGLQRNTRSGGIDLQVNDTRVQVLNSILWGNGSGHHGQSREDDQLYVPTDQRVTLEIDYSIVEGWSGRYGGPGNDANSGLDPRFLDPDGPDDLPGTLDDHGRLAPDSPCIDAGLSTSPHLTPTDLDGHARILCGSVDLGAYERGVGDANCDTVVDWTDFAAWLGCASDPGDAIPPDCAPFDFDGDGDVDLVDYAGFLAEFIQTHGPVP